jgi:hypothetical protein
MPIDGMMAAVALAIFDRPNFWPFAGIHAIIAAAVQAHKARNSGIPLLRHQTTLRWMGGRLSGCRR